MIEDGLKLTVYLGERDRVAGGGFAADALTDIYARRQLRASVLLRGMGGFGAAQRRRTDRLLTLSEDLPLVSVAVDSRPRVQVALADVRALPFRGLVTLERCRLLDGVVPPDVPREAAKLTVYVGRHERAGGRPASDVVVDVLREAGVAGATVLLGVDGTRRGVRRRARFAGRNADVPLMVIAVGGGDRIAQGLRALHRVLDRPLATLERIALCKRDGELIARPLPIAGTDATGIAVWQKLMVYAGEQSRAGAAPLHEALLRELRAAGAAGATTLRGVRGYHGDHVPHGDVLWQLRRRVPVVTALVDTPERTRRWFEVVDRLTAEGGLVTSELVPALQVRGGAAPDGDGAGELHLADLG